MKIRKTILREVNGCNDKAMLTKSLALILFYQIRVGMDVSTYRKIGITHNRIEKFSYNKIKKVTGLHINTIKKRISVAKKIGWISIVGKDLVINKKRIRSSHCRNNYVLKNNFKSIIELQDTLLSFIIVNAQERKDFVKDVFDKLKSPKTLKEYKKARKFVKEKYPQCDSFQDNGMSYKYLITALGIKKTKLAEIIKFAVEEGFLEKIRHIVQVTGGEALFMRKLAKIDFDLVSDYLRNKFNRFVNFFLTKSNVYLCFANSYRALLVDLEAEK